MTEGQLRDQWTTIVQHLPEEEQIKVITQMLIDLMDVTEQTDVMARVVAAHKAFMVKPT